MNNLANLIFPILILVVIVILLIKRMRGRNIPSPNSNKYSWWEILWPFNSAPVNMYKHLSPENKGAFWNVATNALLVTVTCWLGFTVQYLINDSERTDLEKVAHHQIVDRFLPPYEEMLDSCSRFFKVFYKVSAEESSKDAISNDKADSILNSFLSDEKNWENVDYVARKVLEVSGWIAPYVDANERTELQRNAINLNLFCMLTEMLNDTVVLDSVSFVEKCSDVFLEKTIGQEVLIMTSSEQSELYGLFYSLYKATGVKAVYDGAKKLLCVELVFKPALNVHQVIYRSIFPAEKPFWHNWLKMLTFLIVCIVVGYMLFRIIVMRCFDKDSLTPNPRMSQTDLDKLKKDLAFYKKEKSHLDTDLDDREKKLEERQRELNREKAKSEALVKEKEKLIAVVESSEKEMESLKFKVQELESANKSLSEEILHLKENEKESES